MSGIDIILPVWNEEKRVEKGVETTYKYLVQLGVNFKLIIADNCSTDNTGVIGKRLEKKYPQNVEYIYIDRKGVGNALRESIRKCNGNIIGYMDIDLSTDIRNIEKVIKYFEEDDMIILVNASRFNKKSILRGRKFSRILTSYGLVVLLKLMLKLKSTDAVCGFKFFRREALLELVNKTRQLDGWELVVELLLRAEREYGMQRIIELPVIWEDDVKGTRINVIEQIKVYLRNIYGIRKCFKIEGIL